MDKIKKSFTVLKEWEYSGVVLLVIIVLALHLATIMRPPALIFDEQYYVPAARNILHGAGTESTEHPPLGQLIIAAGMGIFGDNTFGWRVFSVVFGVIGIVFLYLICRRLKMPGKYAYLAIFLLTFENLSFVQAGVAMLDVFSLAFMMAALWFYLKDRYIFSGIIAGLAILSKSTGAIVILIIILHWLITNRKKPEHPAIMIGAAVVTFFIAMPLLDFIIWHKWLSPWSQVSTMLDINFGSTFTKYPSEMLSRPWDWIIRPVILTYWEKPHYLAMISPTVWALIIPAMLFSLYKAIKHDAAATFSLIWFAGAYLIWIPLSLITGRTSYIYYFYPVVGGVCISLASAVMSLDTVDKDNPGSRSRRILNLILPVYLLLCLGAYVILSPVSYWWKVPLSVLAYLAVRYELSIRKSLSNSSLMMGGE